MPVYRIGWDMNMPGERRQKINDYIQANFSWCRIAQTDWLIESWEPSADSLWNKHFAKFFDSNDRALVIQCQRNYQGLLVQQQWDWINRASF